METEDLKKFLAASDQVLEVEKKVEVVEKCKEDGPAEGFRVLKEGVGDHFESALSLDAIQDFLAFVRKSDERHPYYLIELGNFLRDYGSRSQEQKVLNEKEKTIISLGISYLEKWMYEGNFFNTPKYRSFHDTDPSDYLAAACFLVNQLAKIKEVETNKDLYSFNLDRIDSLFQDTDNYIDEKILAPHEDENRKRLNELGDKLDETEIEITRLQKKVYEIVTAGKGTQPMKGKPTSATIDFYEGRSDLAPAHVDGELNTLRVVYQETQKQLRQKELEKEDLLKKVEVEKKKSRNLKSVGSGLLKREIDFSKKEIKKSLKKPAGDLYFLKVLIIAAEIIRRKEQNRDDDHMFPTFEYDAQGVCFDFGQVNIEKK